MAKKFGVNLSKMINQLELEAIHVPETADEIQIFSKDVNRPGLHLSGFYEYFDPTRIQIMGKMEHAYLQGLDHETRSARIYGLLAKNIPAIVVTRGLDVFDELVEAAKKHNIPLFRTQMDTNSFMASAISFLSVELAPRITRHGVLVEVYGEGVLLLGESGVGKSENAIELVKRGHRLIADDAVEIRKVSNQTLVGSSPENIRHFLELRGIGIINVRRLFGIGAVKITEKIDMIIQMEQWDRNKAYDRMGMENEYTEILGIKVPSLTIPVKPGRNLAVIVEVAAINNRQKKMGYNAAQELLQKLGMDNHEQEDQLSENMKNWDYYK